MLAHGLKRLGWLAVVALVAGCAAPGPAPVPTGDAGRTWSGRLLLKADTEPPTRFSALFELGGSAKRGRLALSTPLGTTLATAHWQPGLAELRSAGTVRTFDDLNGLTEAMAGTRLPVSALFAWLDGQDLRTDGWQADLSEFAAGRLVAQRVAPPPQAEIRLVLDSPYPVRP